MWHTYVVGHDLALREVCHVKIGHSRDPVARVNHLQAQSRIPLKTLFILEGDRKRELHERFAEYRTGGEWFRVSGELRDFIHEHCGCGVKSPTFYRWMIEQSHRADDLGRLAVIVKSDPGFPASRRLATVLKYAAEHSPHLVGLFKYAHKVYRTERRRS
jgi:hypothetical protein